MHEFNTVPLKHMNNLEFFRIFFILTIILGHIKQFYMVKSVYTTYGYTCDMLFVLSGFFVYFSLKSKPDFFTFIITKIARLLPVIIFSIVCCFVLCHFFPLKFNAIFQKYHNFCALFFIDYVFSDKVCGNNGIRWFVNSLFYSYIFYYCLYKTLDKIKIIYVIGILLFILYSIFLLKGNLYIRPHSNGVLTFFMMRGIAGIGVGYLIANFYCMHPYTEENTRHNIIVWTFLEIFFLYLLMYIAIIKNLDIGFPVMMICFLFLFYSFLYKKGWLSKIFDCNIISFFGKYCYSIYMLQVVVQDTINEVLWKNPVFGIGVYPVINVLAGVFVCILVGVLTYHTVERPCQKLILNYLNSKVSIKQSPLEREREREREREKKKS